MIADEKASILVVDDNPAKRLALVSVLEELNQNLVIAESGRDALRLLLSHEYAVILMDVQMPDMDGFETAALIRSRKQSEDTPIIFVTAYARAETDMLDGYSQGAVDYVLTPIIPEILRAKVSVFVDLFHKTQAIKRHEQQLREKNLVLEAANQELEAFSYSVSHDLRTPLRAIDGFARMLEEDYAVKLDDEAKRMLGVVRENSQNMGMLIDDLLAFSRLGRKPITAATIDMDALVQEVLRELQLVSGGMAPHCVIEPLPAAWCDRVLLRQVWGNLLSNAFKFAGKREQPLIEVSGHNDGSQNVYCVKDNGAGFDMQYYDKLFGVFQRLHGAEEYPGTGVGLAIVQRVITRHGGRVWAEGKVNEGATFYFALPQGEPHGRDAAS